MDWEEDEEDFFEKSKVDKAYDEFLDKINDCIKEDIKKQIKNNDEALEDAMKLKNEALRIKYEIETKYEDIEKQIEEKAKQLSREWIKSFYDIDFKVGDVVYHIEKQYHRIKCPVCKDTGHIKVMYNGNEVEVKCPKCDKYSYFYTYDYKKDIITSIELGLRMTKDNKVIQVEYPVASIEGTPKLFNAYENDCRRISLKNPNYYINREEIGINEEEAKEKVKLRMEKEKEKLSKYYTEEEIEQIFKSVEEQNEWQ